MNQILITDTHIKQYKKSALFFKSQIIISIVIICVCFSYFIIFAFTQETNYQIAEKLVDNFNISRLYADIEKPIYEANYTINENTFSVIALIEIKKLRINYPILSDTNKDLLKLSPTKFTGPEPNEIGNLCIAGHNYVDARFFSELSRLNTNDLITIIDLKERSIDYIVYDIYETFPNDLTPLAQNTNGVREITLITCNNVNGKRLIIKACENM